MEDKIVKTEGRKPEEWKKVEGTNYSVSNWGRVRNDASNKMKIPTKNEKGYRLVHLSIKGKVKVIRVARLVGQYFVDGYSPELTIDHINHVRDDDYFENLRWMTLSENSRQHTIVKHRLNFKKEMRIGLFDALTDELKEVFTSIQDAEQKTGVPGRRISSSLRQVDNHNTRVGYFRILDKE